MKIEKDRDIKIIISEADFADRPENITGLAYLDSDEILVKYPDGKIIIHELIHLLEHDKRTRKAIEQLWFELHGKTLDDMLGDCEFMEYVSTILKNYSPEDWNSEIYAYIISSVIQRDFNNDFEEELYFLLSFVKEVTGVFVAVSFETRQLEVLNID